MSLQNPTMQQVRDILPFPKFKDNVNNYYGGNTDIVQALNKATPNAIKIVKTLIDKKYFLGQNEVETAKNLHNFVRKYLGYRKDTPFAQRIRMPNVYLYESGDCKSKSLFIGSIMASYYPNKVFYRLVNYDTDKLPSLNHVYIIYVGKKGLNTVDGTSSKFNFENPFNKKKDMRISTVTMDVDSLGKPKLKLIKKAANVVKTAPKKAIKTVKAAPKKVIKTVKAAPKKVIKTVKAAPKKVIKTVKKAVQKGKTATLVTQRIALLALISINFRGFATNISKLSPDKKDALFKKWLQLGGNRTKLQDAVNKGKGKKPVFGNKNKNTVGEPLSATVAAALPLIVALAAFLNTVVENRKKAAAEKERQQRDSEKPETSTGVVDTSNIKTREEFEDVIKTLPPERQQDLLQKYDSEQQEAAPAPEKEPVDWKPIIFIAAGLGALAYISK